MRNSYFEKLIVYLKSIFYKIRTCYSMGYFFFYGVVWVQKKHPKNQNDSWDVLQIKF